MARVQDMTRGKPLGLIVRLALPLMLANMCQQAYSLVDSIVVGQGLGVTALAAVGACGWTTWMVISILQGFAQGFSIEMSQNFGAREYRKLNRTIGQSITLSVVISVVLTALSVATTRWVLELMNTKQEMMRGALEYSYVVFGALPITMAYNLEACILRALGDGRTPLVAAIVASVINIVLDVLFVMVLPWGIIGAAAATVIAQLISAVYCFAVLKKMDVIQLTKEDLKLTKGTCWRLMKLGSPLALQNMIISVGGIVVQRVANGFSVAFVAGYTATNRLYGLLEIAAISCGYSMTTYAGQNMGAQDPGRIRKGVRCGLVVALGCAVAIGALVILFGKSILILFLDKSDPLFAEALEVGYRFLFMSGLTLSILYVLHIVRSTLQGMGDTVLPMVSGIAELVMRVGTALLLPALLEKVTLGSGVWQLVPSDSVFIAEILAWVGADVILISSYFVRMRQVEKRLRLLREEEMDFTDSLVDKWD